MDRPRVGVVLVEIGAVEDRLFLDEHPVSDRVVRGELVADRDPARDLEGPGARVGGLSRR